MPELRKDYILDKWVIIAKERGKRPEEFKGVNAPKDDTKNCFFCPGNERMTPPDKYKIEKAGVWQIRVFDNKFAAVSSSGNPNIETHNDFFTFSDAVGTHEVLVETNDHKKQVWDLTQNQIVDIFKTYINRIKEISKKPNVKYVIAFKNHKPAAGTSIVHSHSQIIGYNMIPVAVKEKEDAVAKYDLCPYCKIIDIEKGSDRRCFENNYAVCFTPYASRSAMEAVIFPKKHIVSINELDENSIKDMAELYRSIVKKLKTLNAPFNMYLHYGIDKMHLHMTIVPRTTLRAGFEFGTDTIVNILPPEIAAEFYRS